MEGALPVSGLVQLGFVKAKTVSGKTRIGALAKRARNREKGHYSIFGSSWISVEMFGLDYAFACFKQIR